MGITELLLGIELSTLIITVGYIGLFFIVFAESGLLIGFFLPGDSLLFTAGFLASQEILNIAVLLPLNFLAAVLGDSAGYAFGRGVGPRIFKRDNSLLFNKEHLERARRFYERHGGKAIVLARFMPVVRTFAPILAGVGRMRYSAFLFYNIIGALVWAVGITSLGYFLGNVLPNAERYFLPLVLAIILLSFLPPVIHILSIKDERRRFVAAVKKAREAMMAFMRDKFRSMRSLKDR